ncbi:NAD(P)/FAD-dependent oxidoreductase [Mangrovibrevibacter kandeliae]|uniref:NAD(P)/FAD-dependent oxidoreductase n=1 Tax=Mangrovibrevibacter kandeliae TaxID=2968473 RepID=UPI002118EE3C|nr:FAD-dependent oxidoreductase [Aurantimonas sp. CSK15Z-1]MCQ8784330.1 FAD-dependent oxidoreductase [Aurantimonas sp. CSK15Z-1]
MADRARPRLLILGGGAGGLELAGALAAEGSYAVTLVDQSPAHLWKPRLHEFAAGTVDSMLSEISFYTLARLRGFRFEQGSVARIDRQGRRVQLRPILDLDGRERAPARTLSYDVCVVALGGITADFGTVGVAQHAIRLDGREDADAFRSLFTGLMIRARERREPARVVIVGSGATGTELAAHLRLAETAFPGEDPANMAPRLHLTILEAAPQLMPGADDPLRHSVLERLRALAVEVATGVRVTAVRADAVQAEDGRVWPADLTVWAAGLIGNPVLRQLGDFELDGKGRIRIDARLRSTVDEAVYVMGDAASLTPVGDDRPLAPTAQVASQQAAYLARALPRRLKGHRVDPFVYRDRGQLISLASAGTVGLLGLLDRRDLLVGGRFAIAAYHALQRRHQWAVLGPLRGSVAIFADAVGPTHGPALKLHG